MKKLVVILPAFNEAQVVGQVLKDIKKVVEKLPFKSEIVVIDDGSQDKTGLVSFQAGVTVLTHRINRGMGASLSTGLEYTKRIKADYAITMDSDGQHDPRDIEKILAPLVKKKAEVVIGSRRLLPDTTMPFYRKLFNFISNLLTWLLFGIWTTDSLSGFRGFSKKAINNIHLKTERMETSNEFFAEIKRNHLQIAEVPIKVIYTQYSQTKGQKPSNAFAIVFRLLLRLFR